MSRLTSTMEGDAGWPFVGGIGPEDNNNAPDVVSGVAYSSGSASVTATEIQTGVPLWSAPLQPFSAPAVASGRVFVATKGGQVVALSATSGAVLWTDSFAPDGMSDPTLLGSYVVVADGPIIYELLQATGAVHWSYDCSLVGEGGTPLCNAGSGQDLSAAVVDGDTLYFSSEAFTFAMTAEGSLEWDTYNDEADYAFWATPIAGDGVVYAAALNGDGSSELEALNSSSGAVIWQNLGGWSGGDMALAGGLLYDSNGAALEAWNASTGQEVWSGGAPSSGVAVANDVIFYSGGALDASTGAHLWTNPLGCGTPITLYGSNVFCGVEGELYRFYLNNTAVKDVRVAVGTSSSAGAAASYTVSFVTSQTGGLSFAAQSSVSVSLPAGTTVTGDTGIYADNGSTYEGICTPSGSSASCQIGGTVAPGTALSLDLPVVNPPQGTYQATVATSSDTVPVASRTYKIGP